MVLHALIVLHLLGIGAAAIAAMIEIETIMLSGPLASATGAAIAVLSYRRSSRVGFYLGASAPAFTALCFAIIFGKSWGPSQAQIPIAGLIAVYVTVAATVGLRYLVAHGRQEPPSPFRFRFSMTTMLVLMTTIAITLAIYKSWGRTPTLVWVFAVYAACVIYFGVAIESRRISLRHR